MGAKEIREGADSSGVFLGGQRDEVRRCDNYVDRREGWGSPPDRFLRPACGRAVSGCGPGCVRVWRGRVIG
ncbi:hypothetical protein KBI5_06555 [Frankia sp. KB5]|nr:hypothetical protein KBI5_06555 [Frankia sp. KB5]